MQLSSSDILDNRKIGALSVRDQIRSYLVNLKRVRFIRNRTIKDFKSKSPTIARSLRLMSIFDRIKMIFMSRRTKIAFLQRQAQFLLLLRKIVKNKRIFTISPEWRKFLTRPQLKMLMFIIELKKKKMSLDIKKEKVIAERQRVINNESVVSLDSTLTPELEWIINERMQKQTDAINQVRRAARMTWTEMETQRNLERYKLEIKDVLKFGKDMY